MVEEAQGGDDLVAGAVAQPLLLVQVHEVALDLALGQAIWRAPVEPGQLGDGTKVSDPLCSSNPSLIRVF